MPEILVLGANGQVGFELLRTVAPDGLSLRGLTRDQLDIADRDAVFRVCRDVSPDLIVNAAAYTAVDKAESEAGLAMTVNRNAPGFIAGACRELAIPLIHISTDYVFDGSKSGPYGADDPVSPLGAYGESKEGGEQQVRTFLDQHLILRTAWVFGAHGGNFVKTMLRLAESRGELGVVADQQGGPTAAADIAAAILEMARQVLAGGALWGTYHFASQPTTTWHGFAEEIFAQRLTITGNPAPKVNAITTADYPTLARRPANSVLACEKIAEAFTIQQPDWRLSLRRVLEELIGEGER